MPAPSLRRAPRHIAAALALALAAAALIPAAALAADPGETVRLSLERYRALMARAGATARDAAWTSGDVQLSVRDGRVRIELFAEVSVAGGGSAEVLLLPGDIAVERVLVDGDAAPLLRRGGAHLLQVKGSDQKSVRVVAWAPISKGADGSSAVVPLPPLPGAKVRITGVEGARLWPTTGKAQGGAYQVPATSAVFLSWGAGRADGAVRSVAYAVAPEAQGDGVDVTARFRVVVADAPVSLALVESSAALTSVRDGKSPLVARVRNAWHRVVVRGRGEHEVVATFRLAVDRSHGQPQVTLPLSQVPITSVQATVSGERAVHFAPAVPLKTTVVGKGARAKTTAVGHLPPSKRVTIRWTESRAAPEKVVRVNTETWQLVRLEEGVVRSKVVLDYEVIRGELSTLAVQIPDGVVVYKIEGAGVEDWRTFAARDGKPRQVQISLAGAVTGRRSVTLQLERVAPRTAGAALDVPVVRPLGAYREMGAVALFDGAKVGFATLQGPSGFTPAGQDALPTAVRKGLRDKVNQVFKHVGAPGKLATKVAAARARDVRFDARATTLYDIEERTLRGTSALLVTIKSGRVSELVLSLPEAANEPKVTAPSLNKVQPAKGFDAGKGRRAWRVRFTQALEGAVQLQVEFDALLPKALGTVKLPDVRVHGAEVEEGVVALTAEASIELKPDPSKDLRPVPTAELPRALKRQSERELRYGFRYTHAPWALSMAVQRHRTVQTLDAMVTGAWLETHALESGHLSTRAVYRIRNSDRQFARLTLPKEARVLSVVAGGKRIKPVQDDAGALAVPLPTGKELVVELRYEQKVDALGLFGHIALEAPKLDLRQGELSWTLRTPASHGVFSVSTNLKAATTWDDPPAAAAKGLTVPMPMPEDPIVRRFAYAVHEPDEAPLTLGFAHSSVPESAVETLLFLLGLLGLGLATWRRMSVGGVDRKVIGAALVGALALGLEAAVWGLSFGEGLLVVVLCAAIVGGHLLARVVRLGKGGLTEEGL